MMHRHLFFKTKCETPGVVAYKNIRKGEFQMPTINQLVRQGRTATIEKSKAPALNKRWNSLAKKTKDQNAAQKSYPCQYSCLENLMDREAWLATVHGVTKSWT